MIQPANSRILLVDDEEGIRFTIGCLLKNEGYQVDVAAGHVDAIVCLQDAHYDLAFVDIILGGDSGIDLLRDIKAISSTTQVVMFTSFPEVKSATEAIRLGAFDYITKPVRQESLFLITRHALSVKQMNDKLERYRANMDAILRTVSDSIIMVDKNGCLAHFNATAEKICGYTSDLIGSEVAAIRPGCKGGCHTALLEVLSSKSPREIRRLECRTPEGKSRIINLTASPVTEADGTISGAVAVIRDETHLVELERSLQKHGRFQGIVGASVQMQHVYSLIEALADVPTTVLINGESGTGKELVAAALHVTGSRAAKPFVKVNCSALSESLLESELFGHVRGAFTGAIADRIGRFQRAHGGTLFLDEIGDVSPAVQMRLLRVLQESEFERVGESIPIKVDVRIIAATNQNLVEKVNQGTFRQDLYYRLNVVRLVLPALRERLDDLEQLIAHFISKYNTKFGKDICGVSDDVMASFRSHTWPGNVRELEHAVEHAAVLCKTGIIMLQDLPQELRDSALNQVKSASVSTIHSQSLQKNLTMDEALDIAGGNKSRAAELLGISRRTLYRHLGES
ncbi:MAG: sigma 54-interacting transcriptional regulator [Desulfuromonadaceae bacterium]|nr:sigma 54-interacting transcriptional regulator [Desulfuromonadaceae bacterium]